jgi:hypothetical protein
MDSDASKQSSDTGFSGKLVIAGIVSVAFCAAAVSWWFRYNATHNAVKFWGPEAATLIRDAPVVSIYHGGNFSDPNEPAMLKKVATTESDISNAPGLTHLRNALLEDHNFDWTTVVKAPLQTPAQWGLMFADPKAGKSTTVWLSDDFRSISRPGETDMQSVSVDPVMAKGLREMFAEFSAEAAKDGAKPQAANEAAGPVR